MHLERREAIRTCVVMQASLLSQVATRFSIFRCWDRPLNLKRLKLKKVTKETGALDLKHRQGKSYGEKRTAVAAEIIPELFRSGRSLRDEI